MTPVWVAAAIWLVAGSAVILCRARRRRARSQPLTYGWALPQPKGLAGLGVSVGRSFEAMAWGSSQATWRARCEASLAASRRRRGLR